MPAFNRNIATMAIDQVRQENPVFDTMRLQSRLQQVGLSYDPEAIEIAMKGVRNDAQKQGITVLQAFDLLLKDLGEARQEAEQQVLGANPATTGGSAHLTL